MKVYKLEIMVIDFDEVGVIGVVEAIENARYPNRCIDPVVKSFQTQDIGEWDDSHPLNHNATADAFYVELFKEKP